MVLRLCKVRWWLEKHLGTAILLFSLCHTGIICNTQALMPCWQPDPAASLGASDLSGIQLGYRCSRTVQ